MMCSMHQSRKPSAASLGCILIQASPEEQHGQQAIWRVGNPISKEAKLKCSGSEQGQSERQDTHRYMRTVAMRWPPFSGREFNLSWKKS